MIVKKVNILSFVGMLLAGTSFANGMDFEDDDLYGSSNNVADYRAVREQAAQEQADQEEAVRWLYLGAANRGDPVAQNILGAMSFQGLNNTKPQE